jgi:hypothetical protein
MAREGRPAGDPGLVSPTQMTLGGADLADGGIGGRSPETEGLFATRGSGFRQKEVPTVTPPPETRGWTSGYSPTKKMMLDS